MMTRTRYDGRGSTKVQYSGIIPSRDRRERFALTAGIRLRRRVVIAGSPKIDQQQASADGDRAVGDIERRKFVRSENEEQEIGDSSAE